MENELSRLREENVSLAALVERLEKEGAALAGRLAGVGGQEARAKGREIQMGLQRQLAEAERQLQRALAARDGKPHGSGESTTYCDDMAECLQQELVKMRLCQAENEATIRELRARTADLEQEKKRLHEAAVHNCVAHLQEELIAVKLREAEAGLSLKELKRKVGDLSDSWMRHLQEHRREGQTAAGVLSTPKKIMRAWESRTVDAQRLEEELMSTRIRETETLAELKDLRLKVMELETQVQVSTNQLRRQDEEKKELKEELDAVQRRVRGLLSKQKEQEQKYRDALGAAGHEQMLSNIRFAEDSQRIAALQHRISVLQMTDQIEIAETRLKSNDERIEQVKRLHDLAADL